MNIETTVENKLKARKPLRLKGVLKKRTETLEEFLIKFFEDFNNTKNTIYTETEVQQTDTGRRRSFGDILLICRHYYPNCTVKEVSNLLVNVLPESVDGFRSSYCNTINKRVYYRDEDEDEGVFDLEQEDEFGLKYSDWESF